MNYKTALCNTALGKKLLAQVAKHTCFCTKNCDSNFFKQWKKVNRVTFQIDLLKKSFHRRKLTK